MQAQEPAPFCSLQTAFGPHGDGLQGSGGRSVGTCTVRGGRAHRAIGQRRREKKPNERTCSTCDREEPSIAISQLRADQLGEGGVDAEGLTWLALARGEWIALVAGLALAHRRVVDHPAHGRDAARARTRVRAALVHARQVRTALGAERAFGPTVRGATHIVGLAGAGGQFVDGAAQGVGTARRRLARVDCDVADGWSFYRGGEGGSWV